MIRSTPLVCQPLGGLALPVGDGVWLPSTPQWQLTTSTSQLGRMSAICFSITSVWLR